MKTDEDLEAIARGFRKALGMETQDRPDMLTMIVKLKQLVPAFKYRRVPDQQMPHAEAHWYSDDFELTMRESVFVGIQRGEPRARMTIAEELSHYRLEHKGWLNRSTQKTYAEANVALVKRQEAEAKRMAAILLAPEYLVSAPVTLEELVDKFGLSQQAAIGRKDEIERLRRRRAGNKRDLPISIVDFLAERKRRGDRITSLDD